MMKKGRINCSASGVKFPLHLFIQEILEEVGVNDCNCWRVGLKTESWSFTLVRVKYRFTVKAVASEVRGGDKTQEAQHIIHSSKMKRFVWFK